MRFRRVRGEGGLEYEIRSDDGSWSPGDVTSVIGRSVYDPAFELDLADEHLAETDSCLPFQPLSFRDFMLSEEHNINAARGLVERFHPEQHRAASLVEKVTGKPFPRFRPHKLFYQQPIYYLSNHLTFVPTGTPVANPPYSDALDFELELGFVLSRPLSDASPAEAEDAIGAFVVLNDFSARDVQRSEMASGFGPQKSKHFANSLSEEMVTADEILPMIDRLTGSVAINGTVISTVTSAGWQWSLGEVLAHASAGELLRPGELFGTGTLTGGSGMEIGYWLQPGDTLTLTIDQIGEITHPIVAQPPDTTPPPAK